VDGLLPPHASVASAASCYARAIDEVAPRRPVHLLGHSFGGWVVFEIARLLVAAGRQIGSLTILDSEAPGSAEEYTNTEMLAKLVDTFELILERPFGVTPRELDRCSEATQRDLLHRRLVAEGLMPSVSHSVALRGPIRTFAASIRAGYVPETAYAGPVTLVLVDDPKLDAAANQLAHQRLTAAWTRCAPRLTTAHVPGNHVSVLKHPHVRHLARSIQDAMGWRIGHASA
jgi:thioesterase domain-containing protein